MVGEVGLPWQPANHNSMSVPAAKMRTSTATHMSLMSRLGRASWLLGVYRKLRPVKE